MSYENVLYDIFYSYDSFNEFPADGKIIEKIKSFSNLEEGWDFGEGGPIRDEVIEDTIRLYQSGVILGFNADARPESDGSIVLSLFIGDDFIDISIKPDGNLDLRHEKGIGVNYEIIDDKENVSFEDIATILKNGFK